MRGEMRRLAFPLVTCEAELHKVCRVFTLDRHFKGCRRYGRSVMPLLGPW